MPVAAGMPSLRRHRSPSGVGVKAESGSGRPLHTASISGPASDRGQIVHSQTRSRLQSGQAFPTRRRQHRKHQDERRRVIQHLLWTQGTPEGFENNWIQSIPEKSWLIILRAYGPLQPWIDKTWRPSEIELVE